MLRLRVWLIFALACWSTCYAAVHLTTMTGSIQYQLRAATDQNSWVITPSNPKASKIMIIFTALNMIQAEVRIYDTATLNSGSILLNCASCGTSILPPFYSTSGSITIQSVGTNGVGFQPSNFALQYVGVPTTTTNQLNNTYVNLNMGMAPIQPFLINGILPARTVQQWAIRTNVQIIFSFAEFTFPLDCSIQIQVHNRLTGISKSSIIFQGCQNSDIPTSWFYSSTGVALVVLTSGATASTVNFQLNYFSDVDLYRCGSFIQPALLTDTAMIVADGSKSSSLMKRGVDCTWLIKPIQDAPISLVLNRVSLKFGSSLIVYDGSSSSTDNTVLWNAVGATLTIPPVITSTGNSLFVKYQSDTSNPIKYSGFEGDFSSNFIGSLGSGKGYTQLKMSSALDICPPGDRRTHSAGMRYIWYVAPASSSGVLTFAVRHLKLTRPGDRLTLLEGVAGNTGGDFGGVVQDFDIGSRTVLASYTGDQLPTDWVRTTGTSATILFESANTNELMAGENFQLAYYSDGPNYHCGFTTNPAVLDLPSFVLTDGSSSIEQAYTNQYCTWQIQPRNATSVVLFFERFHLYGGYLRIYTGTLAENKLYVEIGETAATPASIHIPGGVVSLVYYTRSSAVVGYGFALTYYGVTSSRSFPGDRVVTLTSSSVLTLSLPPETTARLAPNTSLQWIISPSSASGRIYIALTHLDLSPSCDRSYLDIYDGAGYSAPLLGRFCGSALPASYSWLQTSTRTAMVHFVSDASNTPNSGNFNLSYFSDGPNFHCGFAANPARMTAPSMVFSDGSGTLNPLYGDQLCEWLLEPSLLSGTTSGGGSMLIVLEFTLCDLNGAKIEIFDGPTAQATLLWQCDGCTNLPGPLISSSNKVFVRYSSLSVARFGQGFELLYWTSTAEALGRDTTALVSATRLLQMPLEFALTSSAENSTAAFFLQTTTTRSSLSFDPFYALQSGSSSVDITASAVDGRTSPSVFESPAVQLPVCGAVHNTGGNRLVGSTLRFNPAQRMDAYLISSTNFKSTSSLNGIPRDRKQTYENQLSNSLLSASNVCKYRLDSGSFQAIAIQVSQFTPQRNGRLRIYGGLNSEDALIFDSNFPELYMRAGSQQKMSTVNGVAQHNANVTAPCGQATIVLELNNTAAASVEVDYSLQLVYFSLAADHGELCKQYFDSLQPKPEEEDPLIPVYIALGALGAAGLLFAVFYYANKLKATQGYLFYPYGLKITQPRSSKVVKTIVAYPKYNARWDQYLNTFLRKGECCVCKNSSFIVMRLKCGHALCLEDLKGYLESALGNISMFPVKCPMHFQGCMGAIDARVAKRILTEPQYDRFNEFSDRAIYGDGMRCIHCQNYVNFPENMEHIARVVCPYCIQSFCVRCKKAWHHGISCAVETYDASLETWKNTSGAQKCPVCKKLIEKDDPDTCNHMIHKITDGIPCIRDRTDFCYCCGEEITGDYPHNEVQNKGVNHFPDGVFQRCRHVVMKEKEAERERLRKIRRMKSKQVVPFGGPRGAAAMIAATSGETTGGISPVFNPFVSTPPGGNTNVEAMWLLEQQYDIETPASSPMRPVSRSAVTTPLMTPSPVGRVHPTGDWDSVPSSPITTAGTANVRSQPAPSARGVGNHRILPTSTAAGSSPTQSARNTTRNHVTRPFSSLEQQILYQQTAIQVARNINSSTSGSVGLHGSASSPQLLLGSPQQQQRRSRPSNL